MLISLKIRVNLLYYRVCPEIRTGFLPELTGGREAVCACIIGEGYIGIGILGTLVKIGIWPLKRAGRLSCEPLSKHLIMERFL